MVALQIGVLSALTFCPNSMPSNALLQPRAARQRRRGRGTGGASCQCTGGSTAMRGSYAQLCLTCVRTSRASGSFLVL